MKSIHLKSINWNERFEEAKGSYYDFVATFYSPSKLKEEEMSKEIAANGWTEIKTNNGTLVFLKERHVIRIHRVY